MIRCFVQQISLLFFAALLFSCSSTNSKPLLIDFSTDSSSIVFKGIDQAGLTSIQGAESSDSVFNKLVSVLETPSEGDTAFKESAIDGHFKLTDSNLVFIPELPLIKGRNYLVITYLNSKFGDIKALLKGELSTGVRPLQQELQR